MPTGTHICAAHFVAGQQVDVTGITIGYGFQGGMKRWGFGGGPSTHGSNFHRKPGAISTRGLKYVPRGKRMAGRTGGNIYTFENTLLWKVGGEGGVGVPGCCGVGVGVVGGSCVCCENVGRSTLCTVSCIVSVWVVDL